MDPHWAFLPLYFFTWFQLNEVSMRYVRKEKRRDNRATQRWADSLCIYTKGLQKQPICREKALRIEEHIRLPP